MTDPDGQAWREQATGRADSYLQQWALRADGPAQQGSRSLVIPVRTSENVLAVLKVGRPDRDTEHEHLVLRRWGGEGAVRLLRADPHHRAVLLERLHPRDLTTSWDVEACEVVASLYRRLHVPAMPQLRSLATVVRDWVREFEALPRNAPIPHRLVEQAAAVGRELAADTSGVDRVVHGDLHYGSVLAGDREPWLAIAPRPYNGDPHCELAPMLWHRWDELAGRIRDGVRLRLATLIDVAGFDEDRARAWVLVRVVHSAAQEVSKGTRADTTLLTKCVALAKAVQD